MENLEHSVHVAYSQKTCALLQCYKDIKYCITIKIGELISGS